MSKELLANEEKKKLDQKALQTTIRNLLRPIKKIQLRNAEIHQD